MKKKVFVVGGIVVGSLIAGAVAASKNDKVKLKVKKLSENKTFSKGLEKGKELINVFPKKEKDIETSDLSLDYGSSSIEITSVEDVDREINSGEELKRTQ